MSRSLNYAKLRNSRIVPEEINSPDQILKIKKEMETKLENSSVTIRENSKTTRENPIFEDNRFNKDNLEYINSLLKAKDNHNNSQSGSKHKRIQSNLEKININQNKQWNPFKKEKSNSPKKEKTQSVYESTDKKYPVDLNFKIEKNEKFEKFEKILEKNEKFEENEKIQNIEKNNQIINDKNDKEVNEKNQEFLGFLQNYIDYFQNENNTSISKQNIFHNKNYKNTKINEIIEENRFLRQKLEQYESKIRELSGSKSTHYKEYQKREEESQKIIKYQNQEFSKMKKYIENLRFKLKYTQDALAKEKIEAENSLIALKKVLYTKMKKGNDYIPTKDKFNNSKEKTTRGLSKYEYYMPEITSDFMEKSFDMDSSTIQEDFLFDDYNTPFIKEKYSNNKTKNKRKNKKFDIYEDSSNISLHNSD